MRYLKVELEKKKEELLKLLPNLKINIDARRQCIYINGQYFTAQEFMRINLNKIRHPSFWGV